MGMKYSVYGYNYPKMVNLTNFKQTNFLVIALFWTIVYSVKYDAVDLAKRK